MRDDLLKEQLLRYARTAADEAVQPDAAAIHRRARRHYRRVAALTVTGVLVALALGVGIGLRRGDGTPTVDQPRPMPTLTRPVPTPTSNPHPATTTGGVAAGPPSSFVALVGPADTTTNARWRVGVVSTSTGGIIRYLTGPAPAGTWPSRPALSTDRAWVYYSLPGGSGEAGTYRVPFSGGPATKVTGTVGASLAVSPDGSKLLLDARSQPGWRYGLAVLDLASGKERFARFPFPQGGDVFGYAWSPDSRQVALVRGAVLDSERFPTQLFLLDVARGRWRTAVTFDARGPAPAYGQQALAWPAPRRVAFVARVAGSGKAPGSYRLVEVDPQTGRLAPLAALANDPSIDTRVTPGFLDFDAGGRYLLYGVDGLYLRTWWLDRSGKGAPVKVAQFSALSAKETHAYQGGTW